MIHVLLAPSTTSQELVNVSSVMLGEYLLTYLLKYTKISLDESYIIHRTLIIDV